MHVIAMLTFLLRLCRFQTLQVFVGAYGHYFGMNHPTTINPGYVVCIHHVMCPVYERVAACVA